MRRVSRVIFIGILVFAFNSVLAQQTGGSDMQKQIDELKKQTELLNAQLQLLQAQSAYQKGVSDAKKAQSDDALAAFKSSLGEVPQAPYTGVVDAKDKFSELPAYLLAIRSLKNAARKIVEKELKDIPEENNTKFIVMGASEVPVFQNLLGYNMQKTITEKTLDEAIDNSGKVLGLKVVPIAGAAGAVLDTVNKLLGFFRTDFVIGGTDVVLDTSSFVMETANLLLAKDKTVVQLPAIYNPELIRNSWNTIASGFGELAKKKAEALACLNQHEEAMKKCPPKDRAQCQEKHKGAMDKLNKAIAVYDLLWANVAKVDEKTNAPWLYLIAKELTLYSALNTPHTYLLALNVIKSGGGYLIKKSMWTSLFGCLPVFYLGGSAVSYALFEGSTGNLVRSGLIPVFGGYIKVSKFESLFPSE